MTARGYFHIDNTNGRGSGKRIDSRRDLFVPVSAVLSIALFITMRLIYGYRVATALPAGDAGHLATAAYTGGIGHPPGYPLFTIIGRFFTHLGFKSPTDEFPAGIFDVAFRMNMMSLWFGVLTVIVVYFIIARALKNPFAAFLGAFLFGVSSTFLSQSLIGEVYTMHAFIVALIIYVALLANEKLTSGRLVFISFLVGLGFAHHTLIVAIILPLAVFLLMTFVVKGVKLRKSLLWGMIIFFILGWLPNLYLPIASAKDPFLDWGNPDSLRNFIDVINRAEYRQIKASIPIDEQSLGYSGISGAYHSWLLDSFGRFFVWLGYIGLLYTLFKGRRFGLLIAFSYFFMTVPVFIYFRNIPEHELFFLEPYFVANHMIFGIFLGYFFFFAFERIPKIVKRRSWRSILSFIIFAGLFSTAIFAYGNHGSNVSMRDNTICSRYSYDVLANIPENSIFITLEDHVIPFIYLQQAADMRRDVVVLQYESVTITDSWFWRSTAKMHPDLVIPPKPEGRADLPVNVFIDQMMLSNSGRPFYFMSVPYNYVPSLETVGFYPAGLIYRYATHHDHENTAVLDNRLYENLATIEIEFTTENLDPFEEQLLDFYVFAYYNYGLNYAQVDGMEAMAELFLLKSYNLKPDGPGYGVTPSAGILAEIYMENNEWLSAHNVLKKLIETGTDVDSVYYYMNASALIQLRRFAEARLLVEQALEFDPENQFLRSLREYLEKADDELYGTGEQPDIYDLFSFESVDDLEDE